MNQRQQCANNARWKQWENVGLRVFICRRTSKLRQRHLDAAQWFWVGSDPRFRSAPHSFTWGYSWCRLSETGEA